MKYIKIINKKMNNDEILINKKFKREKRKHVLKNHIKNKKSKVIGDKDEKFIKKNKRINLKDFNKDNQFFIPITNSKIDNHKINKKNSKNKILYDKENKNNLFDKNLQILIKKKSYNLNNKSKNYKIKENHLDERILGKKRKKREISPESNYQNEQSFSKSTFISETKDNVEIKIDQKESENMFEKLRSEKKKDNKLNISNKKEYFEEKVLEDIANNEPRKKRGRKSNKEVKKPIINKNKIQLFKDENFFSDKTDYIKYDPLNTLSDSSKVYYLRKNIINEIKYPKFLPILLIPRIKPLSSYYQKLLEIELKGNFKLYENNYKNKEKELYSGSFILKDEKHFISVNVPCFSSDKVFSKRGIRKRIKQYTIDNDKDTDSDTANAEKDRGFRLLCELIINAKKDKKYLSKSISRKIRTNTQ